MEIKSNDINFIKKIYFEYGCNLYYYFHDGPVDLNREKIIKIMKENGIKWSFEFQKIQKKEILLTNSYFYFNECYSLYVGSLKSYDQMFDLFIVFSNILLNKSFDFCDLFVKFYELILFDERIFYLDKRDFKENNIIEYFKKNDSLKYKKIISIIDKVLKKDKFKETDNKEIVDKVLKIIKL